MSSSRENRATRSNIDKSRIFASGANMHVYKGVYTRGERSGEECVSKVFKTGSVFENAFFAAELKVVDEARSIIETFNAQRILSNSTILVNIPEVWEFTYTKEKNLVEPFIQNFQKFNSNTGWTPRNADPWMEVMQALSHYSYHITNGRLLLCDLQGGIYQDGFILTDPVIISQERGEYGPTDLGEAGMATFFSRHKCNQFCSKRGWSRPQNVKAHFAAQQGTSMELVVPTRYTRAPLSRRQPQYNPPIQEEYSSSDSDSYY
ncbi:hypothetical protein Ndes2526B_g01909 [Nannochloris sp. 'desiccata']|nr:hypothetical protein KSW81_005622 [Chlorella desiccata (nom. nud.)]KAH7623473.1 putative Alpha-protein kinase vwkA [Chlorella desiccata (nom. nud.)]